MSKTLAWMMYAGMTTALLAATAAATANHETSCGGPDQQIVVPKLELQVWIGECAGAIAEFQGTACFGGIDEELGLVHVLVLSPGYGCQTGAVIDFPTLPDADNFEINPPSPDELLG